MELKKLVKPYEEGKRTMDGYTFDGRAEFDMEAIERAYKSLNGYQLERKADELIDSLYDGYEPIYETDIGLCSVTIHWETKEPLVWCTVKGGKLSRSISIDNGATYCTPAEALNQVSIDTLAQYMDDDIRELVARELAPCTDEAFLVRYLELAVDDLIIG